MPGLKVDLRTPSRWTLPALHGASVLLLALSGGWLALHLGHPVPAADEDGGPAVVAAMPTAPQPDARPSVPTATVQALADEARAWSAEASFPMGPLFAWLEASAAPDVRLVSVEARAQPRQVLLEVRADRAASIAPYLSTLARSSGPAARWALKSIRADVGQGGVTAAIEGAL